ncbi:MAG: hypothetical protein JW846_03920 [Dehalococcoidia bacterium]|nr:hypothetical protein [Dehalococcoidia bacterium]
MNHPQVRAIELLAEQYAFGAGSLHARKVAALAGSLFDQLSHHAMLPGLTSSARCTLVAAAYAHDIGFSPRAFEDTRGLPSWTSSSPVQDHQHLISFEVLRAHLDLELHAISLPPFSAADRSSILYSVLWSFPGSNRTVPSEPLIAPKNVALMAGILRIADALDVRHRLMVQQVELRRSAAWIRLLVRAFDEAGAEVAAAQDNADLLRRQLGLHIFVQEMIEADGVDTTSSGGPFSMQPEDEKYLAALFAREKGSLAD